MNKKISLSMIFSILSVMLSCLIAFLLTKFLVNEFGSEANGYYSLAKTITSYLSVLSVAINSFASRYIAIEFNKKNYDGSSSYFSTVVFANLFLSIIFCLFFIFFISFITFFLNIEARYLLDVRILFGLVGINFILALFSSIFQIAFFVADKITVNAIVKLIGYSVEGIVLIILFTLRKKYLFYVGIALVASNALVMIISLFFTKKQSNGLEINIKKFDKKKVKVLVGNGIWNSLNSAGGILQNGLDLWISNIMLAPIQMGQVSVSKTFSSILSILSSTLCQPFQPSIVKDYSDNNINSVVSKVKVNIKFNGLIFSIILAIFIALGIPFFMLYCPAEDYTIIAKITCIVMLGDYFVAISSPMYFIYTLTIKNLVPCLVTIGCGIINVISMIILLKFTNLGVFAIVITTCCIGFFGNLIFTPIYSSRCLKLSIATFYPTILRVFLTTIIECIALYFLAYLFNIKSWVALIGVALLFSLIGFVIYFLVGILDKKTICKIRTKFHK